GSILPSRIRQINTKRGGLSYKEIYPACIIQQPAAYDKLKALYLQDTHSPQSSQAFSDFRFRLPVVRDKLDFGFQLSLSP
ncbi:MAG: hypothetical protein LBD20_08410, partial [Spirochaetaceae bacterium]|nr:hypothetical protein [Spirochaetaceae bacterium]